MRRSCSPGYVGTGSGSETCVIKSGFWGFPVYHGRDRLFKTVLRLFKALSVVFKVLGGLFYHKGVDCERINA